MKYPWLHLLILSIMFFIGLNGFVLWEATNVCNRNAIICKVTSRTLETCNLTCGTDNLFIDDRFFDICNDSLFIGYIGKFNDKGIIQKDCPFAILLSVQLFTNIAIFLLFVMPILYRSNQEPRMPVYHHIM